MKTILFICCLVVMGGITLSLFFCDKEKNKMIEEKQKYQDSILLDSLLIEEGLREIIKPYHSSPTL